MRHKAREMLVSQRTQLLNGLRGHLTEVGVIAAQGPRHARELAELIEACDETIPFEVCEALSPLVVQLRTLDEAIARLDRAITKLAQRDETARRLMSIPGFGLITASAMAATIQDTSSFAGPREFAAFLGLTPKQNSSGGKQKLGRISKMGNRNLRKLLVVGAHAVLFHRKPHGAPEIAELAVDLHKDLVQVPSPLRITAHVRYPLLSDLRRQTSGQTGSTKTGASDG